MPAGACDTIWLPFDVECVGSQAIYYLQKKVNKLICKKWISRDNGRSIKKVLKLAGVVHYHT